MFKGEIIFEGKRVILWREWGKLFLEKR